jgi:hypothetical protein
LRRFRRRHCSAANLRLSQVLLSFADFTQETYWTENSKHVAQRIFRWLVTQSSARSRSYGVAGFSYFLLTFQPPVTTNRLTTILLFNPGLIVFLISAGSRQLEAPFFAKSTTVWFMNAVPLSTSRPIIGMAALSEFLPL